MFYPPLCFPCHNFLILPLLSFQSSLQNTPDDSHLKGFIYYTPAVGHWSVPLHSHCLPSSLLFTSHSLIPSTNPASLFFSFYTEQPSVHTDGPDSSVTSDFPLPFSLLLLLISLYPPHHNPAFHPPCQKAIISLAAISRLLAGLTTHTTEYIPTATFIA